MPRTLAGDAQNDMGPCDPRCTLELHQGREVSNRVRRRYTERINDLERRRANARLVEYPGSTSTQNEPPNPPVPALDFSDCIMQALRSPAQPQLDYEGDPNEMNITMPSWGLPTTDLGYAPENDNNNTSYTTMYPTELSQDEDLNNDTDGASDAGSESSDIACRIYASSPITYDYVSSSDSEDDANVEAEPSVLDRLYSISPVSSQEFLPESESLTLPPEHSDSYSQENVCSHVHNPEEPEFEPTDASEAHPSNVSPDVPPTADSEPEPPKALPDGLRALREWILSYSSSGDLTVDAANSLLKTLDFCLEKDLLRCGAESNPEHRLPLTLEALQRRTRIRENIVDVFAVCPDFSCQTLRRLGSMNPDQPYNCEKCGKTITRRKVTRRRARKALYHYVPILRYTYCPIVEQLKEILSRPRILKAIDEHRQHLKREGKAPGTFEDIQDGTIWLGLTKEGEPFFNDTNNIGLILMCDWFQPNSRQGAPSYSTGVISLCIANLPPHLRARPENKIIVGVTPGPHEPNVDTINNFLEPMVHELVSLWNEGVSIDNPEFPRRTRHEHKTAAKAYSRLPNKAQRQKFLSTKFEEGKPGGYRPSILLNLPYWNPEKMMIVDPMHCLFSGLVDWQFHTIWVEMKHLRPGKELIELQEMVQSTLRPRHCGRPPGGLGTSAAGSLTADPLRSLITIDLPLAIPVLWDKVNIHSAEQRAHEEWASRKQIQEKKQAEARQGNKITRAATKVRHIQEENAEPAPQIPRKRPRKSRSNELAPTSDMDNFSDAEALANAMRTHEDDASERGYLSWRLEDDAGVLLLASAMKYLASRTVTEGGIKVGKEHRGPQKSRKTDHRRRILE